MTTAPLHTKPFNIEHARDGAPFCCANGDEVDIIKWDRNHRSCIIGLGRHDASLRMWRSDGSYSNIEDSSYTLVMTPLAIIDDKPVFVGDEMVTPTGMKWFSTATCRQDSCLGDCSWPAPERVYPETRMGRIELATAGLLVGHETIVATGSQLKAIANAALRHAIDCGQVMLPGGELDDTTILKAFEDVGIHWKTDSRIDIIKAVKSLLVTEPEVEKLKRDLAKADRELIQFAAKAAGLHWASWDIVRLRDLGHGIAADMMWNPIKSDADALRLAVKVPGLSIQLVIAEAWQLFDTDDERLAYVRRAITSAAADIGEAMP